MRQDGAGTAGALVAAAAPPRSRHRVHRSLWLTGRSQVAPSGTWLNKGCSHFAQLACPRGSGARAGSWGPSLSWLFAVMVKAVCSGHSTPHSAPCRPPCRRKPRGPQVASPTCLCAGLTARPTPRPSDGRTPSLPSTQRVQPFEMPAGEASLNQKPAFVKLASPSGSFG